MSDWAEPQAYSFKGSSQAKAAREQAAQQQRARGGRSYAEKRQPNLRLVSPKGKTIQSASKNPLVVAVDVTGSMQHWPYEIFDRLPLLYQTLSQYRPDLEVSFIAVGDAYSDRWPLQVCDFSRGIELEDQLAAIHGEGGGGGQSCESYELLAYFLLEHTRAPEAEERPFLILYGDEGFYERIDPAQVRALMGDPLREPLDATQAWGAVAEAWNVYHLRKPYSDARQERNIQAQWEGVLGRERIVLLDDEQRAVDLALGIVARAWGRFDDFESNMSARQDPAKVRALAARLADVERLG